MIAVKSPVPVSPRSAFSSYSVSPSSPAGHKSARPLPMPGEKSAGLQPFALIPPAPSALTKVSSPSFIAPSSNGTDGTEIDDLSNNAEGLETGPTPTMASGGAASSHVPGLTIRTTDVHISDSMSQPEDEPPQSVIHAPTGFTEFRVNDSPPLTGQSSGSSSQQSDVTIKSPLIAMNQAAEKKTSNSPISPPTLTTSITRASDWSELATPLAQTRQEVENLKQRPRPSSLADIPETLDPEAGRDEVESEAEPPNIAVGNFQDTEDEINALRTALAECWTLCNTLAILSYIHRERLFNFAGKGDMQEQAWKSCWKLCQNLYDNRDNDYVSHVRPTLDLCRDFCQALFEVRVRDNEIADSVLRVSFELNNHLYNTHDRNLPEAFRERTLDFYITLCHRLMKQRTRLEEETDSLLRACWSLAEMLFSLRQNKREGKRPDEELLGSAVQACWELCDLFREGWTQIRPDRGTPRPSQTTFTQAFYQAKRSEYPIGEGMVQQGNPETPTTIFEDTTTISPDEAPAPNIVVLGPGHRQVSRRKWSSNSSTLSGYSRSSEQTTSSSHTVRTPAEDPNLTCLKLLIIRAAMNSGYQRNGSQNLSSFVKSLSSDSFGTLPWQTTLLDNYKKLVSVDPAFRVVASPARAGALDAARAVQAMVQHNGQYLWLRDLYFLVFGFHTEDAAHRKSVTVQT